MFRRTKAALQQFEESHGEYREVIDHFKRYQLVYGVAASSAVTLLICRTTMKPAPAQIINTINNAPVISPVVNTVVNNGGHMRKIIRCIETDEMWSSMSKAAEAAGYSLQKMSDQIHGRTDHLDGLHYVIEGLAAS